MGSIDQNRSFRNPSEIIKAEDDFLQFESRFTVIEDAEESIFHKPEEVAPNRKCANCSRWARLVQRATGLKTGVIEEDKYFVRIASEYKTFELPLCEYCAPPSIRRINIASEINPLTLWGRHHSAELDDYTQINAEFLENIRADGWRPILNQNLVYFQEIRTLDDYLGALCKHYPALPCLFQKLEAYIENTSSCNITIEFIPGTEKRDTTELTKSKCAVCSEPAVKNIVLAMSRTISMQGFDIWSGVGHDFGVRRVPVCQKCYTAYTEYHEQEYEEISIQIEEIVSPQKAYDRGWMILHNFPERLSGLSTRLSDWFDENYFEPDF